VSGKDVGGALPDEEVVGLGEVTGLGAVLLGGALLGGADRLGGGVLDGACVGAS
jgi:hypothetical protein